MKIFSSFQVAVEPYLESLLTDTQLLVNGELLDDTQEVLSSTPKVVDSPRASEGDKKSRASGRSSRRRSAAATKEGEEEEEKGGGDSITATKTKSHERPLKEMNTEKGSWANTSLIIFGSQVGIHVAE